MRHFNEDIEEFENGIFRIGASVRLQKLINTINEAGYGGLEYLYSVPGLVGGAVVMNAGRGKKFNQSICDYILYVEVIRNEKRMRLEKKDCQFTYRNSIFKNSNDIITIAVFQLQKANSEVSKQLKQERIELCKEIQDASKPNFGTVFMVCDAKIMNFAKKYAIGKGNVHFSKKQSIGL